MASVKDFYKQEMNAFEPNRMRGEISPMGAVEGVITAIVDKSEAGEILPGDGVSLVATSENGLPKVIKATDGTKVFGFATYNIKKFPFVKGDTLSIAIDGAIMYMAADVEIEAGAEVQYEPTTGYVKTTAGTKGVVGVAMDKIAANAMGRVVINTLNKKVTA